MDEDWEEVVRGWYRHERREAMYRRACAVGFLVAAFVVGVAVIVLTAN